MKTQIYYVRQHESNHPVATVAVHKDDNGVVSRGVAICSNNDQFSKKSGTAIAMGRLQKALSNKSSDPHFIGHRKDGTDDYKFNHQRTVFFLSSTEEKIQHLYEYDVVPTDIEKQILED